MLMSVGKLSSISEMLTISDAASLPPGERQRKEFSSFVVSVQFEGTVKVMPWTSQTAFCPPAIAAACAAVGTAFSAVMPPSEVVSAPGAEVFLNRFERLHRDKEKQTNSTSVTCFIWTTSSLNLVKSWCFYSKPMLRVKFIT